MKSNLAEICLLVVAIGAGMSGSGLAAPSLAELRERGAFEFPQPEAKVLCDTADLRFSVWNNDEHLFAQAVLWKDNDSSLGKTEDKRRSATGRNFCSISMPMVS